jgi:hypothetical protein
MLWLSTFAPIAVFSIGSNQYRNERNEHNDPANEQRSKKPQTDFSVAKAQADDSRYSEHAENANPQIWS